MAAGLDARAAAIVMQSIKNVSRNGRTVMVTIHQPSIDIFESFDALVLLQRGGKVYFSVSPARILPFQSSQGVPHAVFLAACVQGVVSVCCPVKIPVYNAQVQRVVAEL